MKLLPRGITSVKLVRFFSAETRPPPACIFPVSRMVIIECDSCNRVVTGLRFKCTVCADYDLCEECNAAEPHPHLAEHTSHGLTQIEPDTVTMAEVIAEETALLEDAQAVLGAADDEKCTYPDGYLSRQAVFACLTCFEATKQASGVCLACSLACHATHDIVELYTKVR